MENFVTLLPLWVWIGIALVFLGILVLLQNRLEKRRNRLRGYSFTNDIRFRAIETRPENIQATVPMVSYVEVRGDYERRHQLWRVESEQVLERLNELERLDYRLMDAERLLHYISAGEIGNLAVILGIDACSKPATIVDALRKAGSNGVASFVRGQPVPYKEVVQDVALKLGAKRPMQSSTAAELERLAVGAAMEKILAKASPDERKAILAELTKSQATPSTGLVTATGGLLLANLSGFGLYIAASSSLAAITGAVGLTLPFAVYSGMSSVLAAVTGPAGWIALALVAVVKFGGAEYKKTVPGVIAIASSRARLIASREEEMAKLHKQRALLEERGLRLDVLEKFVEGMCRAGTDQGVPRASVPW